MFFSVNDLKTQSAVHELPGALKLPSAAPRLLTISFNLEAV
jgi:hypothetical protein